MTGVGAKSAEQAMQQNNSTRGPQASVSAALASAHAGGGVLPSSVRFPGEDGGHSLAEMAQRDLDAALQLLADRAQYITGASGAAIALRRSGRKDMLCRASAGANAPELGALLSTEFGLSGESVRTRQPLRCDDAERDARVNRDVCRQMGIASVVVMPVVNDDEVLGVFELFSGKANAFGARDVSAVQRLSEMVETAVRLARAMESLPERLKMQETAAPEAKATEVREDQVLDGQDLEDVLLDDAVLEDQILEEPVMKAPGPVVEVAAEGAAAKSGAPGGKASPELESSIAAPEAVTRTETEVTGNREAVAQKPLEVKIPAAATSSGQAPSQKALEDGAPTVEGTVAAAPALAAEVAPVKKKLFWSAALNPAADAGKAEEADQSHVPPVLRSLRKCEACGFPVSAGRVLCVECEEKKWRGKLKVTKAAPQPGATSRPVVSAAATPKTEARAFAAGAQAAASAPMPSTQASTVAAVAPSAARTEAKEGSGQAMTQVSRAFAPETASPPVAPEVSSPGFVLSAGMAPSQSWLARNKYILGVLLVVVAGAAVVWLMR